MDLCVGQKIDEIVEKGMADRVFPGIVCGVWKDGREVYSLVKGHAVPPDDPELAARPMARDTVFDLASLTKPLSTAILVMKAVEAGTLRLDDTVSRFLRGPAPEYASPAASAIPVRELLTHTGGLPAIPALEKYFPDPFHIDRNEAVARLLAIAPERPFGESVVYSCTGFMLLGLILESISGLSLGELFRRELARPLGLAGAGFAPELGQDPRDARPDTASRGSGPALFPGAAPTEFCAWRKRRICAQVHDESSWCLGGQAGNAGFFATLDDVAAIASIYLQEGLSWGGRDGTQGVRILERDTVRLMTTPQTGAAGERRSLGLRLHDQDTLDGPAWPDSSFGHTGFTGTSVFMDPGSRLMAVCLTNRVYYGREQTVLKMPVFRRAFHTAVYRRFAGAPAL